MWLKIGEGWGLVGMADSQGRELFVNVSKIILYNAVTISAYISYKHIQVRKPTCIFLICSDDVFFKSPSSCLSEIFSLLSLIKSYHIYNKREGHKYRTSH